MLAPCGFQERLLCVLVQFNLLSPLFKVLCPLPCPAWPEQRVSQKSRATQRGPAAQVLADQRVPRKIRPSDLALLRPIAMSCRFTLS